MANSFLSVLFVALCGAWWIEMFVVQADQPFPKPQYMVQTQIQHYLDARAFAFHYQPGSQVCDLITVAFNRYYKIIFNPSQLRRGKPARRRGMKKSQFKGDLLKRATVNIKLPCEEYPNDQSDESCMII